MERTFSLADSVVHIDAATISADRNDPGYWDQRGRPELRSGHVMTVFSYTDTWAYQERHPTADELAVVLRGRATVLLQGPTGEEATALPEGAGCVVPAGAWHRLGVEEPCTLLFVTPVPCRTDHRELAPNLH